MELKMKTWLRRKIRRLFNRLNKKETTILLAIYVAVIIFMLLFKD
jgi:hypothetical protein